jgi:hypothetical protein
MPREMIATGLRLPHRALTCVQCGEQTNFTARGLCSPCRAEAPPRPYGTDAGWCCYECGEQVLLTGDGHDPYCEVVA